MEKNKNRCGELRQSAAKLLRDHCYQGAISLLEGCLLQYPDDVRVLVKIAEVYVAMGDYSRAEEKYFLALDINPVHTKSLVGLSSLLLSGDSYLAALELFHQKYTPKRYLEIGVCKGESFKLAGLDTISVGIDPEPQYSVDSSRMNSLIFKGTSDDYFYGDHASKDFMGGPIDMSFLDGMHLFEYALRDFINVEQYSHSESVVFIHDLFPINAESSTRVRNSEFWTGDVWKLVLCLKDYRPDLNIHVLSCPPTGLGMITGLNPNSKILAENYDQILDSYIKMSFSAIESNKKEKLLLRSFDVKDGF